MCVVCHEPLAVAQSPEAFQERDYVRGLVLQGQTEQQILRQHGGAVRAGGAGQAARQRLQPVVYIIPPVVAGDRDRRRSRSRSRAGAGGRARPHANEPAAARADPLSADDAHRLDEDLAREL